MKTAATFSVLLMLLTFHPIWGQQDETAEGSCNSAAKFDIQPEKVSFPRADGTILFGWLYKPKGKGPFPAIIWNHGSGLMNEPGFPYHRKELATLYAGNGYVFFTPHRKGHGLSRDAGPSAVEEDLKNCVGPDLREARKCRVKYLEEANLDTVASVKWLQTQRFVKKNRIAVSGASYGGIQTILTSEKDLRLRAFVAFTPAAMSWANLELRQRLHTALEKAKAPVFLIQAEGDFSIGPYEFLGGYLKQKGGLNGAKLYPKFGTTPQEAHGAFAIRCQGIEIWGKDVLGFLKAAMK